MNDKKRDRYYIQCSVEFPPNPLNKTRHKLKKVEISKNVFNFILHHNNRLEVLHGNSVTHRLVFEYEHR